MLVARQPIYDTKLRVVAYELLFREVDGGHARVGDDDAATSHVLLGAFNDSGLRELVGDRRAHLDVSRRFLEDGHARLLPPERIVLELTEHEEADPELESCLERMRDDGYCLALSSFLPTKANRRLAELVDLVALDLGTLDRRAVEDAVRRLAHLPARLMATTVETQEDLEFCRRLGFDLYQGYFLCTPKLVQGRGIPAARMNVMRLVATLNGPHVDLAGLDELITRDVGLSYGLLRYINSAFFGLRREVTSVRQALVFLGLANVRRWATLLALVSVDDKPHELLVTALLRARMTQLLGPTFGEPDEEGLFTVGLFSVIDAIMDAPMTRVLESLPFSDEVVEALLEHEGPKGGALHCVLACERGDVEEARRGAAADAMLGSLYLDAANWATAAADELSRPSVGAPS